MDNPIELNSIEQAVPPAPHPVVQKNIFMAALSYIGPFVIVSYLLAKNDPFVKFHIRQGLVLLGIEIVFSFITSMLWVLWIITPIVDLGILVLSIIGIVNAVQSKENELPIIGHLAVHIPL